MCRWEPPLEIQYFDDMRIISAVLNLASSSATRSKASFYYFLFKFADSSCLLHSPFSSRTLRIFEEFLSFFFCAPSGGSFRIFVWDTRSSCSTRAVLLQYAESRATGKMQIDESVWTREREPVIHASPAGFALIPGINQPCGGTRPLRVSTWAHKR